MSPTNISERGLERLICTALTGSPCDFELKNSLTKQTVADAIEQYKQDRNQRERLFELGRCVVHFAVADHEVRFCTHLKGNASWFLPFNRGWNDGAGNPPNPDGLKTDYLWKRILTRKSLTDILENYAQMVVEKDPRLERQRRVSWRQEQRDFDWQRALRPWAIPPLGTHELLAREDLMAIDDGKLLGHIGAFFGVTAGRATR